MARKMTTEEARAAQKRSVEVKKQKSERMKKMSVKDVMLELLENPANKEQLCKGLIESASKGNAKSAELLLKIIGEDPSKQKDIENDPFA